MTEFGIPPKLIKIGQNSESYRKEITLYREKLFGAMTEFGIPPKLIRLVKTTTTNT